MLTKTEKQHQQFLEFLGENLESRRWDDGTVRDCVMYTSTGEVIIHQQANISLDHCTKEELEEFISDYLKNSEIKTHGEPENVLMFLDYDGDIPF